MISLWISVWGEKNEREGSKCVARPARLFLILTSSILYVHSLLAAAAGTTKLFLAFLALGGGQERRRRRKKDGNSSCCCCKSSLSKQFHYLPPPPPLGRELALKKETNFFFFYPAKPFFGCLLTCPLARLICPSSVSVISAIVDTFSLFTSFRLSLPGFGGITSHFSSSYGKGFLSLQTVTGASVSLSKYLILFLALSTSFLICSTRTTSGYFFQPSS